MARRKYLNGKPPKIVLGARTYGEDPWDIEAMADDAMRMYGHPEWAYMILENQRDILYSRGYDELRSHKQNSQLLGVLGVLKERAKRGHWDTSCYKDGMDAYLLGRAREKLGEPTTPIGTWDI